MIVEGCDILLDVNQVFVRQGSLIQIPSDKPRTSRSRLTNFKSEKEALRQCFLFSNHLILATRTSGGRLHLVPDIGKIPLADALLIEDPSEHGANDDDESSVCSMSSQSSGISEASSVSGHLHNRDFKIILDVKTGANQVVVHLVAPTMQEKAAWISDISQCMDNVHFNDLLHSSMSDTSSVTMPQSIKNDPKLFKDDVDIRFSRTLNSCKVPQIRYATPERLLERLTDLRFLSIDFLNTFLLTYRVFTDGVTVLEALKKVFYNSDPPEAQTSTAGSIMSLDVLGAREDHGTLHLYDGERRRSSFSPRRTSGASSVSGYGSEVSDRDRSHSYDSQAFSKGHWRCSYRKFEEEQRELGLIKEGPPIIRQSPTHQASPCTTPRKSVSIRVEPEDDGRHLTIPKTIAVSSSSETLTDVTVLSAPSSPSNLSSVTLVGSSNSETSPQEAQAPHAEQEVETETETETEAEAKSPPPQSAQIETKFPPSTQKEVKSPPPTQKEVKSPPPTQKEVKSPPPTQKEVKSPPPFQKEAKSPPPLPKQREVVSPEVREELPKHSSTGVQFKSTEKRASVPILESEQRRLSRTQIRRKGSEGQARRDNDEDKGKPEESDESGNEGLRVGPSSRSASITTTSVIQSYYASRRSIQESECGGGSMSHRTSLQHDSPQNSSKAGVVITSFRQSQRRSSTSSAAAAFAIATSASSNPRDHTPPTTRPIAGPGGRCSVGDVSMRVGSCRDRNRRKESVMSTAATMRVLNVLRHWVSKHAQDFELDQRLKNLTIEFLDDIIYSPNLLPAEHKAASQLLRLITREEPESSKVDLNVLLAPPMTPSKENIETLSALEIAEQMTYVDHQIFISISSEEFLGQAWMKTDKASKAPHIILMTKRFNEVSQLVVSEIVRRTNMASRIAAIEKWAAVADISRCLHNFNGVLQVCAAFTNSSVFRLKKTWEKVSKTTKQTIEKLQNIVSSDGRFRNLRDALHRCDPPCIPYLGMYLTDLSFIEEGTPNFTEDGLLNFSKMRMLISAAEDGCTNT